jgi:hypothetical protein
MCPIPNDFRDRESYFTVQYTVHCTGEQHAMSSHELQSAVITIVKIIPSMMQISTFHSLLSHYMFRP